MELGRYLAIHEGPGESKYHNLRRYIPWRKFKRGSRQTIKSKHARSPIEDDEEQWEFLHADQEPSKAQLGQLIG